ncbi:MAG: hypothetical protein EHM23_32675 [Acidobacteria bacterium]|nr:MAG: hypothetical protein EHM23_32675 [Acidobacteriota bacterium]
MQSTHPGQGRHHVELQDQTSVFLDASLFQAYFAGVSGAFEGTLKLSVTNGGPISVISLIQNASNHSLLVVPVESAVVGP